MKEKELFLDISKILDQDLINKLEKCSTLFYSSSKELENLFRFVGTFDAISNEKDK